MLFLCPEVDTLYGAMEEGSNHIYINSFCELKQIYYSEKCKSTLKVGTLSLKRNGMLSPHLLTSLTWVYYVAIL